MPSHATSLTWRQRAVRLLLPALILSPAPVLAQTAEPADPPPSESAMVNLVRALVRQGALTEDVGAQLVAQAEAEAAQARSVRQAASADLPSPAPGAIRVPYIPETVRNQIKEELRAEVLQEARAGNWAAPDLAAPDWTRRIQLTGDVRVRSQSEIFARTNANNVIDFATINALSPYGIDDQTLLLPILNTRNNRWNNARLRARVGIEATITDRISAGVRIATGDNEGPISTNATLAGGFFKRDLWLDRAWVKVDLTDYSSVQLGRFENPFRSSDLLYDADLNLDGAFAQVDTGELLEDAKLTARAGAFPIEYGAPNAPTFASDKPSTPDKYLLAAEIEVSGEVSDIAYSMSSGYHVFRNFQGDLSTECLVETASFCSTDYLQPLYLTKGNTLSPLRRIRTQSPTAELPQLLGYTYAYRILDVNAMVRTSLMEDLWLTLGGSYVKNLAFDERDICRNGAEGRPYNNDDGLGTYCAAQNPARFVGGDTGYRFEAMLGADDVLKRGTWQLFGGYRYLESDAVLDAFSDSDFHLGGTNSKGYFIGGKYAVIDHLLLGARWLSANEIAGPPLAIDVLQVDVEVEF